MRFVFVFLCSVYCGVPYQERVDFTSCTNYSYFSTCTPVCAVGYQGIPTAECKADGQWEYGGSWNGGACVPGMGCMSPLTTVRFGGFRGELVVGWG